MIDVHIIKLESDDPILFQQCLDSLANEPVTIHIVNGVIGDVAAGRIEGLSKGTHRWVSWVDPDDYIIPGTYQKLLDAVGDKKFAWADEEVWIMEDATATKVKYKNIRRTPHHMAITDRELIDWQYMRNERNERATDWLKALQPIGVHLKEIGYVWRSFGGSKIHEELKGGVAKEPTVTTALDVSDAMRRVFEVPVGEAEYIWLNRKPEHRVDCHVLVHHSLRNPENLHQMLESVIERKTNILLVVDRTGNKHIGSLRQKAFSLCEAEFQTFIDDDDYLLENVDHHILDVFDNKPEIVGVYTNLLTLSGANDKPQKPAPKQLWSFENHAQNAVTEVWHYHVFRREALLPLLDGLSRWDTAEEAWLMIELARYGDWSFLERTAYAKRRGTLGGAGSRIKPHHLFELGKCIRSVEQERNS